MAYSNKNQEKEYQFNYHKLYKPKMLQKLKDELKTLSQQHEIETYIDDFVFIYEDVDECTSTLVQITWYQYLLKYIKHRLKVVH
jgi:predicted house-cleaning noncanonical NTP pyrophosphatase (MazG superfamily)